MFVAMTMAFLAGFAVKLGRSRKRRSKLLDAPATMTHYQLRCSVKTFVALRDLSVSKRPLKVENSIHEVVE